MRLQSTVTSMLAVNRLLIQIVPQLRPAACGVSDHAISLAQELEAEFGIGTAFVVLNSTEPCNLPFPTVYCKPSQLLEACISLSKGLSGAVLVHYSGYGYSADGAPLVLAEALQLLRRSAQFRIGVYFHELFATGMPWTSAFWYTHRQRQVALRIARECDLVATNVSRHSDWLESKAMQGAVTRLQRLPVFSNVGETVEIPPMCAKRAVLAVLGLAGTREKSYRRLRQLGAMLNSLGIEEILDVGPEFDVPANVSGIAVRRLGVLSAGDLGNLLSKSNFGFVPHSSFSMAKSGIFAGLCAHATIPVIPESFSCEVDGLRDGVHLISPRTAKAALSTGLERCSTAAWNWYSGHRLSAHAATYARLLVQPLTDAEMENSVVGPVSGE